MITSAFCQAAGLTETETAAWLAVQEAARACLAMNTDEPLHPMEREELCHAFHDIQARLLSRPSLRLLRGPMAEAGDDEPADPLTV